MRRGADDQGPRATADVISPPHGAGQAPRPTDEDPPSPRRIVATYDYIDERGDLLFQVLRYQPKGFAQRKPDGAGGWIWGLGEVRRALYHLPQLLARPAGEPVFVVEGEKDADRLTALGLVATTAPGGVSGWRDEYAEHLRDATVYILPDADHAGERHAQAVAASLDGIAGEVRIVALPGLPPKGDVSDFLDAGGTVGELLELCAGATPWAPPDAEPDPETWRSKLRRLDLLACKNKPRPQQRFVITGWAPVGVTGALTGIGGRGKTTVAQTVATCVHEGISWIGCTVEQRPAAMLFGEESLAEIEARQHDINTYLGADFASQTDLHLVSLKGEDATMFVITNDRTGTVQTTALFDTFREMVLDTRAGFAVIDHWGLIVAGPEGDRHATGTVINLLSGIAEATGGFLLVLQHPSRAAESEYSGNSGFLGGVRTLWHLKDGKEDGERVLRRSKANAAATDEVRLHWDRGLFVPVDVGLMTVVDMLAERERRGKARETFLAALDTATAQRRKVSHSPHARASYAPRFFVENGLARDFTLREVETAMRELFAAGQIIADQELWRGADRHRVVGLARSNAG